MSASTKIIRRRIRSIKNTKKITKAMEMVAASKMRHSVKRVLESRSYALMARRMALHLASRVKEKKHLLLVRRSPIRKVGMIIFSSNRGLCGGFNSRIIAQARKCIDTLLEKNPTLSISWIVAGKKAAQYLAKTKQRVMAEFIKPEIVFSTQDISALSTLVLDGYIKGEFDQIFLVYTDFVSVLAQKSRVIPLLPLQAWEDEELGQVGFAAGTSQIVSQRYLEEYEFEPNADVVLDLFLRRLVLIFLYQAALESTTSEHSARMMAMRQATDAAEDMMTELNFLYNQARQASITKEIAEIAVGKQAME